jgi:NADH:ubiquinone oxidoreductase subunit 6 (subunit J)
VYSALFLVLAFCNTASLLFLLQLEFLPISFIVVYVGAIAVLFLFVLMMLNIKLAELKEEKFHYIQIAVILGIVFILELSLFLRSDSVPIISLNSNQMSFLIDFGAITTTISDFSVSLPQDPNMKAIGHILFVDYSFHFIVSGFVLLLAMVGAIILTLHKKFITKSQQVYAQVLRDFNKSIVYYN